ncbi:hypothetical protein WG68_02330 [Arsukibacterium ikkense]|uniref:Uncharacterized protein n=1 Tax=Arsukibacterium ikkense TaxID=336831 RepID=A0A0M2VB08_9GAMM|nr:hypothetical protein [Arsukibacterium ikkense]KKO46805.1 hypothetical protein WG68_02330 [Arsukibacterium ikkense]
MRWLSSFAILVYLSLLCSPQALAVHDSRLSPLADTQLQALNPALYYYTASSITDHDDSPPVALFSAITANAYCTVPPAQASVSASLSKVCYSAHPARAPPVFSSH